MVLEQILDPAGMQDTGFFRSDSLPARAAPGYLTDGRTNILHLPVRGAGDGGVYSTVGDMEKFWSTLLAGEIVPPDFVELMTRPHHNGPSGELGYGLGFWLRPDRETVVLMGQDVGVSATSAYSRELGLSYTVLSNTTFGAWPIRQCITEQLSVMAD